MQVCGALWKVVALKGSRYIPIGIDSITLGSLAQATPPPVVFVVGM